MKRMEQEEQKKHGNRKNDVRYFLSDNFPGATSQIYNFRSGNFPNDNFPSGNFPLKENGIFPMKDALNEQLSFTLLKSFSTFFRKYAT